jgi:hypothetical protein
LILPDRPPIPLHTSRVPALSPAVSLLVPIRRSAALAALKILCPQACKLTFRPRPNPLTLSVNPWSGRIILESPKQNP